MHNSKLVEWLGRLTPKERKQLQKFVASPYFSAHPRLPRLLELLLEGKQGKEDIWAALFPDQAYDDLRLRHLASDLMELCTQHLAVARILGQSALLEVECLRSLRERAAGDLYEFTLRKFQRRNPVAPMTSDALLNHYLLEAEHNAWLEQSANRSGQTRLQEALDGLDAFYFFNKLKYACTALNNQKVVDIAFHNALMEEILAHLDSSTRPPHPVIDLYRQTYRVLSQPDEESHYQRLKALLGLHSPTLPDAEARDLYAFAMNHCIGRINAGDLGYLAELFDHYRIALERGFLLEQGRLSPWDYKNITVTGLRLSEYTWVEGFIHRYKEAIAPEQRENAFTYNLARLHFHRKEYGEVLRLLQKVEYEDVFYNLDSKVMLLKIYYESGEVRSLDSLIESFRSFLDRNRLISDHHRTNYGNLVRFVKRLSRLRPGDRAGLEKLRQEVGATTQLADAGWLREKIEAVEA